MAKKTVNKSEQIRTVLAATPAASLKEVVATLKAKGIDVSENLVYGVKKDLETKASNGKKSKKAAAPAKTAPVKATAASSNVQKTGNKSEEIRTVLAETPSASAKDVVATLKAKGIDTNESLVYSVKQNMAKKAGKAAKANKKAATAAAPAKIAAPSSNGRLGVGASIAVAKAAAEKVGGWSALKEIVDALQ